MTFFIDENLPPNLVLPLRTVFPRVEFRTSAEECLGGTLDIPLFDELRARGFSAIITQDASQVVHNDCERRALHDRELNWIGVKQPAARGVHLIAMWTANITAALPHIITAIEDDTATPSWFAVTGLGVEASQRMRTGPLWREHWR
ncbi:MAG: hypothetical protein ABWY11_08130 [Umezawaea sp.]